MLNIETYKGRTPAWCPGCGNFSILKTIKETLAELEIEPHQITLVSGIGQAAKLPHYLRCNFFNGLHGRALPVATGIRLANPAMPVIVTTGDGDCYGEGGNHLMAAIRRNVNIKLFVHDNQIYGLTKGQPSPTTGQGTKAGNIPFGVLAEQFNPLALAVALDASFAARAFAGDPGHLKDMMKQALEHPGFALIDILQPCVTFNKVNTFEWYRKRVYRLGAEHDPVDRIAAFSKALEWGDRIPLGLLYRAERKTYEEQIPILAGKPSAQRSSLPPRIETAIRELF
jgi:2-oxoglutarate/2-oxoacid ferredoxin oxidoreductase subunit beta